MTTESLSSTATRVGAGHAVVRRARRVGPLTVGLLAIFTATAQAHIVTATATCKSVTFEWSRFSPVGFGNGGLNTPEWTIVFTPSGGSRTTTHGRASFAGSSFSLTVAIPSGDGAVTASSWWSSSQTRDGNSNSGTNNLTITNCPTVPPPPEVPTPPVTPPSPVNPPAPVKPPAPVTPPTYLASPPVTPPTPPPLALSTRALATTLGGPIRDTAVLSGGLSPRGTITFSLYSPSDLSCSKSLRDVTVAVNGDGRYDSPPITPTGTGSYQWVATYVGDEPNSSLSAACDDPAERSTVAPPVCVRSRIALHGLVETVGNSVSAYVVGRGVKTVTFFLDGHELVTVTKPSHHRFSVTIDARRLSFGVHRLTTRVTMRRPGCASAEVAGTFIHVKPSSLPPQFAG